MRRSEATTAPGALVGEYRIESVIGEGGMGTVYAAVHSVIDKRVALKVLRRELSADPTFVSRFVKEGRTTNRIGHPNIVDVFGFGVTPDGRAYLAMELLEGQSLWARLQAGRITLPEACNVAIEISHALEAAHSADIVHRDLKPENVFLANNHGRSVVKLLDFGIAKFTVLNQSTYTQPGVMLGTPTYIAPEQARGETLDGRADIYALGAMLFEMLAGRPPFHSNNAIELIALHLTAEPPLLSTIEPGIPGSADRLLASMLAKDPAGRPTLAHVRESLEELRVEIGAGQSGIIPMLVPRAGEQGVTDGRTTAEFLAAVQPRRPLTMILLGLLALTIGFTLVVELLPYFITR